MVSKKLKIFIHAIAQFQFYRTTIINGKCNSVTIIETHQI